ncbi:hypothetical protein VCRA2113O324_100044 [Vibrio crassostreae]|nr:hypothetical protein VCRA2113O324_100044 [Vibrio crassostreae]CAK2250177.1 hypothetical protein VCRA2111O320_80110 [Vibrio crassostreae]CAK2574796.1 hypothetical protein VCRA2121O336_100108 [Vibrio crassostreae]CAK3646050.1 hypothetical protein VCRA217O316_80044 [Vibrio crassostreae]CAK3666131.1 hypothetical protein VCRA2120O329_90110 [Vibrio crassostreae]
MLTARHKKHYQNRKITNEGIVNDPNKQKSLSNRSVVCSIYWRKRKDLPRPNSP